ncbi:ATP-binding cassette sub-family F member 2 [Tupaia chinensis]|uniref:ATP-binding cassette sub-family F member 2 n=1 Tax=Tupaia chinensis TaxID=246437 RepID=L9JIF3_TUPCH|nr:ATP-binding cassette sub-family F member 2 [Tupaia chinensis]
MLYLNEPTNDLGIETIDELADAINEFEGCMMLHSVQSTAEQYLSISCPPSGYLCSCLDSTDAALQPAAGFLFEDRRSQRHLRLKGLGPGFVPEGV